MLWRSINLVHHYLWLLILNERINTEHWKLGRHVDFVWSMTRGLKASWRVHFCLYCFEFGRKWFDRTWVFWLNLIFFFILKFEILESFKTIQTFMLLCKDKTQKKTCIRFSTLPQSKVLYRGTIVTRRHIQTVVLRYKYQSALSVGWSVLCALATLFTTGWQFYSVCFHFRLIFIIPRAHRPPLSSRLL